MKRILISFCFVCLTLCTSTAIAQEWSAVQKEVWKNVETYWDLSSKGDIEGFLTYFHSDFSGWANSQPLPDDRATRAKGIRYNLANSKTLFHTIKPLSIKIHGNIAIVQYSYTMITKYKEEAEKSGQGRWTDIVMKQGNKWVMIGDHGGATSEN